MTEPAPGARCCVAVAWQGRCPSGPDDCPDGGTGGTSGTLRLRSARVMKVIVLTACGLLGSAGRRGEPGRLGGGVARCVFGRQDQPVQRGGQIWGRLIFPHARVSSAVCGGGLVWLAAVVDGLADPG